MQPPRAARPTIKNRVLTKRAMCFIILIDELSFFSILIDSAQSERGAKKLPRREMPIGLAFRSV